MVNASSTDYVKMRGLGNARQQVLSLIPPALFTGYLEMRAGHMLMRPILEATVLFVGDVETPGVTFRNGQWA